jgi:hypothetical protein
MDMRIIGSASLIGIPCILLELAEQKVKVASMSSRHPMTWPEQHATPPSFIDSKRLKNTSSSGTKTNMPYLVSNLCSTVAADLTIQVGNYLDNHYREASEMVHTLSIELDVLRTQLSIIDDDFSRFHEQERQHLHNLKQPSPEDQLRIRYVSALDELVAKK